MKKIQSLRISELHSLIGKFALSLSSRKDKMDVFAAMNLARESRIKPEHNLRVAALAIHFGSRKPDYVISALLHSSLEDRFASIESLQEMFGLNVALMVASISDPDFSDNNFIFQMQELYLGHIRELIMSSKEAAVITVADFYDNVFVIEECKDTEERRILCAKYKPVFKILTAAIEAKKIRLKPQLIPEILSRFNDGLLFVKKEMGES